MERGGNEQRRGGASVLRASVCIRGGGAASRRKRHGALPRRRGWASVSHPHNLRAFIRPFHRSTTNKKNARTRSYPYFPSVMPLKLTAKTCVNRLRASARRRAQARQRFSYKRRPYVHLHTTKPPRFIFQPKFHLSTFQRFNVSTFQRFIFQPFNVSSFNLSTIFQPR